ncbi:peptidoglycan-binding protein [Streptomyces sp. NPDC091377]|uniref:peptidoglycan-binding protein n=1 Tax=Streptomyces sp. NPDC091377 TaxID=3365995 RepID=UPI003824B7E3
MTTEHTEPLSPAGEGGPRDRRRRSRTLRRTVIGAAVAAAVTAGVLVVAGPPWSGDRQEPAERAEQLGTAAVRRASLSSGMTLTGRIGYGDPVEVTAQGQGTFTRLPAAGDDVAAGQRLYEIDGEPVVLFTGDRPFWRELAKGVDDGADVEQLKRNLVDLGHAAELGLAVDEEFTDGTVVAVKRWQKALGVRQTGKVELGRAVVLPQREVRVQEVTATPGSAVGAGAVLEVTGPELAATVRPEDEQLPQFAPGSRVTVALATGGTTKGTVRSITRPPPGEEGAGGGQGGAEGDDKATVTLDLADQGAARKALRAARPAVSVTVSDRTAEDVLTVPVTALLALADGGYGLRVRRPGVSSPALVPVEVGLVADARAEVSGKIREGDKVVVPS